MAAPAEHANTITLAPADEPEAVVLDLMHPVRPGRHGVAEGRQAGLDEAYGMRHAGDFFGPVMP